jgi:hypothetical protein
MSLDQHAEQILLESNEDLISEPSEDTFNQVTAQLVQVHKWKRHNLGTQILDNKFLFVKQYQNGRSKQYWANLLFANPVPQHERHVDWRWGIAALILLVNAAGLFAADYYFHLSAKLVYFSSIAVVAATLGLISFLMLVYKYRNTLNFNTLNGGAPILSLSVNNPSKPAFQAYVNTLSQCIERIQKQYAGRMKNQLANELAEHRRLKDHKVITDRQYDEAKNRILSQH